MGESISVSIEALREGNPRLCLSPKRALNKCYLCHLYDKCESKRINPEKEELIKRLKEQKKEHILAFARIDDELKEVLQ